MAIKKLFTSESVTEGHPDKLCDQVSDGVLDAVLAQDPMARVACETCTTTGVVMVMGEMTTTANISVEEIVRETVKKIGYDAQTISSVHRVQHYPNNNQVLFRQLQQFYHH